MIRRSALQTRILKDICCKLGKGDCWSSKTGLAYLHPDLLTCNSRQARDQSELASGSIHTNSEVLLSREEMAKMKNL